MNHIVNCALCGIEKKVCSSILARKKLHFCDQECRTEYMKEHSTNTGRTHFKKGQVAHNFKGGTIRKDGYKVITINGKRHLEHHINWMRANEFYFIPCGCVVHHKNGIRDDNRPENLVLMPADYHSFLHQEISLKNSSTRGE
jgi:hypothetical protein